MLLWCKPCWLACAIEIKLVWWCIALLRSIVCALSVHHLGVSPKSHSCCLVCPICWGLWSVCPAAAPGSLSTSSLQPFSRLRGRHQPNLAACKACSHRLMARPVPRDLKKEMEEASSSSVATPASKKRPRLPDEDPPAYVLLCVLIILMLCRFPSRSGAFSGRSRPTMRPSWMPS